MTGDEATAIRAAYAGHPDEEFVIGLVEQVMMWQSAARYDGLHDLRNMARVARGDRRNGASLVVTTPCDCHCCQRMDKAEEEQEDRDRVARRRRVVAILHGWRP